MSGTTSSSLSGSANDVVQARDVSGGIHFHGLQRPAAALPRQLPAEADGFVGREDELARLESVIAAGPAGPQSGVRVAVVVGTAGSGKSALAVRFAHHVADRFPDGQLFVNLRGYDSGAPVAPQQALERFLRALGVPARGIPQGLEERAELYRSLLAGRRILVLADNAATVGQVRPLLPGDAACIVLVTSRNRLSGLSARDGARRVSLGLLPHHDSVALVQQAVEGYRAGDPPAEVDELVRLCARLPLALRIAAERAAVRPLMPLRDLIRDLRSESSLWDALSSTDDGSDTEADAVRAVFSWSYRALPPTAARVFRLLGVLPTPDFGPGAAAAVTGMELGQIRGLLDLLVGTHLLEQTGPERYQFHDLLRAYAAGQARQEEKPEDLREALRQCAAWYLTCAQAATEAAFPTMAAAPLPASLIATEAVPAFPETKAAADWYRLERENLGALARAVSQAELWEVAWRLPVVLQGMHSVHLALDDWLAIAEAGQTAATALDLDEARIAVLTTLADACSTSGRAPEALAHLDIVRQLCEQTGDEVGAARALMSRGQIQLNRRALSEADATFREVEGLYAALGDELTAATAHACQAFVALDAGHLDRAAALADEVEVVYRRIGTDQRLLATPHMVRAQVQRELGHAAEAAGELDAARQIAEAVNLPLLNQSIVSEQAEQALAAGRAEDALELFWSVLALGRKVPDAPRTARAHTGVGRALRAAGRSGEAVEFLRLAVAAYRGLDDAWNCAEALTHLAGVLGDVGQDADALVARVEAAELLSGAVDPRSVALLSGLK